MQTNLQSLTAAAESPIVLSTLNARYIHSAFGLRYLHANLGELQSSCVIEEFTLESRAEDVVEAILAYQPKIVGFGVYIWNINQTQQVLALLRAAEPALVIVLGGPEVSYEQAEQPIIDYADYVISGWGDISFSKLCHSLFAEQPIENKFISGEQPPLKDIKMPYDFYSEQDIKHRILYVEASRGCPFKCEFCLSALDKTAWPFDLAEFLRHMSVLYQRGARHFKFVDRTFNLKVKNSLQILEFFLERLDEDLFLHFEVIPDHLPDALKAMIAKFPVGSLQFEIGIQTFNPEVQGNISRRQNNQQAKENLQWIRQHSNAYIHADLIFGLPGDTLESFADSFDQLYALQPHEIQVGILKRLKGSPIIRHTEQQQLVFNPNPPYSIVSSAQISYQMVQQMNRFARYWDMIGNSGRFKHCLPVLLENKPFARFSLISESIYQRTGQTHKISLLRLYDLVYEIARTVLELDSLSFLALLKQDFQVSGLKSIPKCLRKESGSSKQHKPANKNQHNRRQARHDSD